MKKQEFSFVKWLTIRDIQKILETMNLEITKKDDGSNKLKITRAKDENGHRYITVFCKYRTVDETQDIKDDLLKEMAKTPAFGGMMSNIMMTSAVVGTLNQGFDFSNFDDVVMLRIDDFYIVEELSLKPEKEQNEFDKKLTRNYQDYMTKKFGRFYNSMKGAYIKKMRKQVQEEQESETK